MAKRLTDTDKWKKPFVRGLQGAYKLLWFYICDDCDHAGIWQVDLDVASLRIGENITQEEAEKQFGDKIVPFDGGEKWFIPDFINFQYSCEPEELNSNPKNKTQNSAFKILEKYGLLKNSTSITEEENKGLTRGLQAPKDKDKYKDKEKDKDNKGGLGENFDDPEPAEEIAQTVYVPNEDFPEEEFAAAQSFFKGQSFYNITRKQHSLDEETIDDYFRRFYEKRFGELLLERKRLSDAYKSQMDLIKHFYGYIPYLKKTIAETTPKTKSNGNKKRTNTTSVPTYQPNF